MSDYKCDICEKKATVHITKFVGGQKLKFHLCEHCAELNQDKLKALIETQIALKSKKDFQVEDIIADILEGPKKVSNLKVCPHCNSTFEAFEKSTKVACQHCYKAFAKKFEEIIGQMHLATVHTGKGAKKPKKATAKRTKKAQEPKPDLLLEESQEPTLEELSVQLEGAIAEERYEDAALLRDKIKSLKNLS